MCRLLVILFLALVCQVWALGCENTGEPSNCKPEVVQVSERAQLIAESYRLEVQQGHLKQRTNMALNAIVRFAALKLRLKGKRKEAKKLIEEWESGWDTYLLRTTYRDLGDHKPLSTWLAEKYAMWEFVLGVDVCHALRLDDIKILNFGIPVVFACVDNVDVTEYGKHFIPLSGTVTYWTAFFSCIGSTWGTGFLWCGAISWGAEFAVERFVAPQLNESIWKLSCQ